MSLALALTLRTLSCRKGNVFSFQPRAQRPRPSKPSAPPRWHLALARPALPGATPHSTRRSSWNRIGTSTSDSTPVELTRAGSNSQLFTASSAALSSIANPELSLIRTRAALPSALILTLSNTVPCCARRRAPSGYSGSRFFRCMRWSGKAAVVLELPSSVAGAREETSLRTGRNVSP